MTVGKDIQSSNFSAGSAGWRIRGNGDIELNEAIIRGELQLGINSSSRRITFRSAGGGEIGNLRVEESGSGINHRRVMTVNFDGDPHLQIVATSSGSAVLPGVSVYIPQLNDTRVLQADEPNSAGSGRRNLWVAN
jgi:hypothetical protein